MSSTTQASPSRPWYRRVGPGLIIACVVIGPGSIMTSSGVGAEHGYAMSWVVLLAVMFMLVFTSLGAKLGVVTGESSGSLVARRAGRPLAVLIGLAVFFISAAFQSGNNLGVHYAFKDYLDAFKSHLDLDYTIVVFNVVSITFLFAFQNLYRAIERLMMAFVGLMLLAFALNLAFAGPDLVEMARGLIPGTQAAVDIKMLGLVGTTFVITAAYFQTYLVRQKGWGREQLADGLLDARVGAVIMALITLMIMATAAAALRGQTLKHPDDVARGLAPLFHEWGRPIFYLGLFSAAYSSFLVNSMIGGFILADGLGLGSRPTDLAPRICTTVVLLTGMTVALVVIKTESEAVPAIAAAQAVTVIASPLIAGTLWWLTSRRDIMGEDRNGPWTNVAAGLGFLLLLGMSWYTATEKVLPAVREWWG